MKTKAKKKTVPFAQKTRAEQRVQIAKDVIAQINLGRLKATSGTYFSGKLSIKGKDKLPLKEVLGSVKSCEVCAIGAAFVCAVDRNKSIKVEDFANAFMSQSYTNYDTGKKANAGVVALDDEYMRKTLGKYFTHTQLTAIERVFEGWGHGNFSRELDGANLSSEDRLIAIMQRVIEKNGSTQSMLAGEPKADNSDLDGGW